MFRNVAIIFCCKVPVNVHSSSQNHQVRDCQTLRGLRSFFFTAANAVSFFESRHFLSHRPHRCSLLPLKWTNAWCGAKKACKRNFYISNSWISSASLEILTFWKFKNVKYIIHFLNEYLRNRCAQCGEVFNVSLIFVCKFLRNKRAQRGNFWNISPIFLNKLYKK